NVINTERPWVGVHRLELENFSVGQKPSIMVEFLNSGKSPAFETTVRSIFYPMEGKPPTDAAEFMSALPEHLPDEKFLAPQAKSVVFPGGNITEHVRLSKEPMDQNDVARVFNKETTLVLRSWLEYRDTFGEVRHTQQCVYYNPDSQGF